MSNNFNKDTLLLDYLICWMDYEMIIATSIDVDDLLKTNWPGLDCQPSVNDPYLEFFDQQKIPYAKILYNCDEMMTLYEEGENPTTIVKDIILNDKPFAQIHQQPILNIFPGIPLYILNNIPSIHLFFSLKDLKHIINPSFALANPSFITTDINQIAHNIIQLSKNIGNENEIKEFIENIISSSKNMRHKIHNVITLLMTYNEKNNSQEINQCIELLLTMVNIPDN